MVARIAPEPISTNVSVAEYRSRAGYADSRAASPSLLDDPLPPVPAPVPAPVPGPIVQSPSDAFVAAQLVESLPSQEPSLSEFRLRLATDWRAPDSALRLADRQV